MSTNQTLVVNQPLIDYLRLTTYDWNSHLQMVAKLRAYHKDWEPKRWLQYKGQANHEGIFYGHAEQRGRVHAVIQISGLMAHNFWTAYKDDLDAYRCTRIDLQSTKTPPPMHNAPKVYKRLQGRKSLIQSDTGDTLYIGSRTSDTFIRIYDKTPTLLRLEFELKGAQARRAFTALMQGMTVSSIYNATMRRSRCPKLYVDHYWSNADDIELPDDDITEDMIAKLDWFKTLDGLAYKLANDHDTQGQFSEIIGRWYEYCKKA